MVGCCVARLLARFPAVEVTLVDIVPERAAAARALGVDFAGPQDAPGDRDLVVHTSATAAGLQLALDLLRPEGTVLDMSWYGDTPVSLQLGGTFHSSRLAVRSSQVGLVSPARRSSRTAGDRLSLALDLLRDDAFDAVLAPPTPFRSLPQLMTSLVAGGAPGGCHTISYDGRSTCSA
jgi:threonine dehydrogenase-like Zn-dependent dehydrogenase